MIQYTQGNLLHADTEAVVNTVNTVGVMGKGVALAFKETYPENFTEYEAACKAGLLKTGRMFVTENRSLHGPRWIINFPTKKHWRQPSRFEWIVEGLADLRRVVLDRHIRSIAIPPLGCGNGGLDWEQVRPAIAAALEDLADVDVRVYEPTAQYQTSSKASGVEKLTPARALVAESIRRYWILGIECTLLEIQKLAYFLEGSVQALQLHDPLKLQFAADRYGPYSDRLRHLLNSLDGSYLHSEKRIADAAPLDVIWFDEARKDELREYLEGSEASGYRPVLERTLNIIRGFESPLGMEVLATLDWLISREHIERTVPAVRQALVMWPGGEAAGARKQKLFDDRLIGLALERLAA
jgi:O-acetyl-ADP-ribose deacetylase (regulator of RNase III)